MPVLHDGVIHQSWESSKEAQNVHIDREMQLSASLLHGLQVLGACKKPMQENVWNCFLWHRYALSYVEAKQGVRRGDKIWQVGNLVSYR